MSSFAADHNIPNSTIDDIDTRWPLEIQCHDAVSNVPDIAHTVCLREPKSRRWINNYDKSYRIYVNWCARGDLHDLIELYAEANGGAGQALPEPLLWHVAEALAKSGISMQTGSAAAQNGGPQPGPVAGWRPIVHRVSTVVFGKTPQLIHNRTSSRPTCFSIGPATTTGAIPECSWATLGWRLKPTRMTIATRSSGRTLALRASWRK